MNTGNATRPPLSPGRYNYDDLEVGDQVETGATVISAVSIDTFAELTGDRFEIHMSDEAAARHGFNGRVAHGLLVLSAVDGLKNQALAQFDAMASLGWDWTFKAPVIAGDSIHVIIVVSAKRETRDPRRGILTLCFNVRNQAGVTVQAGTNQLMVYRRPNQP